MRGRREAPEHGACAPVGAATSGLGSALGIGLAVATYPVPGAGRVSSTQAPANQVNSAGGAPLAVCVVLDMSHLPHNFDHHMMSRM